jgi:hypothetical protein
MQERENQLAAEQRTFELERVSFMHRVGEQEKLSTEDRAVRLLSLCAGVVFWWWWWWLYVIV